MDQPLNLATPQPEEGATGDGNRTAETHDPPPQNPEHPPDYSSKYPPFPVCLTLYAAPAAKRAGAFRRKPKINHFFAVTLPRPSEQSHSEISAVNPLFAVELRTGMSDRAETVLYRGPAKAGADTWNKTGSFIARPDKAADVIWAEVSTGRGRRPGARSSIVSLPAPAHSLFARVCQEPLDDASSETNGALRFSIEVPTAEEGVSTGASKEIREKFEWRPQQRKQGRGNRRLSSLSSSSSPPIPAESGDGDQNDTGVSWYLLRLSEAHREVVATWSWTEQDGSDGGDGDADETRFSSDWVPLFKFQLQGSGSTGNLGDRWAVMALVTALRIWHQESTAGVQRGLGIGWFTRPIMQMAMWGTLEH